MIQFDHHNPMLSKFDSISDQKNCAKRLVPHGLRPLGVLVAPVPIVPPDVDLIAPTVSPRTAWPVIVITEAQDRSGPNDS